MTRDKLGDSICSSQQLLSYSYLVGPWRRLTHWTGLEGTSCKRRVPYVHQLRSAMPSIHLSGCHLRTRRSGERQGDRMYLKSRQATQLWQHVAGSFGHCSPCVPLLGLPTADTNAPLMSCTLKPSPAPTTSNPSKGFCLPAEHRIVRKQVPPPHPTFKTSFFSSTGAESGIQLSCLLLHPEEPCAAHGVLLHVLQGHIGFLPRSQPGGVPQPALPLLQPCKE